MILIDTSVWIEFFRGKAPYFAAVRVLLENRQALAVECIFAELMQGAKTPRERGLVREMWESLPKIEQRDTLFQAGEESGIQKWAERGIGLIDAWIVISGRNAGARIWSLDKKLNSVLGETEIYRPV